MPSPQLPHSPETERAVLAALLLNPASFEDLHLEDSDFHLSAHRTVFRAYRELVQEGQPIDLRTVQGILEQRGELDKVGGIAYLAGLDLDLPDIGRVDHYAEILRDRTTRRRLLALARRLGQGAMEGTLTAGEVAGHVRRQLEDLEDGQGRHRESSPASELVRAVLTDAQARREQRQATGSAVLGLTTGLPRVDGLLCGLSRGLYLLAGAPGVGKTTLALQMALHAAREAPVLYLTFENSPGSLLTKALCSHADGRTPMTARDVVRGFADLEALQRAAAALEDALSRLVLIEGDSRLSVGRVRALARQTMETAGAERCLIVVDYLQLWAKTSRDLRAISDVRAKVDTLGGDLVELACRLESPVLALSSQSRAGGAYGAGRGQASLDSFKESGDLEYAADVAAFLTSSERQAAAPAEALELVIKKNRHGPTGSVSLLFRPDLGTMREEARDAER
jgi:replicative DNA helicase